MQQARESAGADAINIFRTKVLYKFGKSDSFVATKNFPILKRPSLTLKFRSTVSLNVWCYSAAVILYKVRPRQASVWEDKSAHLNPFISPHCFWFLVFWPKTFGRQIIDRQTWYEDGVVDQLTVDEIVES